MKKIVLHLSLGMILFLSGAFKSQETGQIYFMRSTNNVGSLLAYRVYIDDQVVCHLKNQRYSVHNVTPGEHTVSIKEGGLGSKGVSRPMKIKVEAGKSNYMVVINGKDIYMQESVESSAQELLKRLAATTECLPDKKDK
ncbi:DUF2846 domain-containing protein [Pedobacter nyackensis]|uniref:DUF2846 domain-containing protein n=1 Tax=Pedobacter nyackensis TaxID=475255 RepID=UPI002930D9F7|nr:DUF2846 domain-containing protein [Pedobacter nyackensis]